jgi:HEPN superfamily RiboL-PSP-like protein
MKLPQIDHLIEVCKKHLEDSKAWGTEIAIYLTGYLLVVMCAAFEECIEGLVNDRASRSADTFLAAFVRSATSQLFRSPKTSSIAGLLGRFGKEHGERFTAEMRKNERAETFFNNLVLERHGTAHKAGSDLTFSEVVGFYSEAHTVLDAVALVIGLT